MSEVKWIKIMTDIFDDEKILMIEMLPDGDSLIVIWIKLLCLAGKQNNSGVFILHERIPYTDEMFAAVFRRPVNTIRLALSTFEKYGMIEIVNDTVTIPNWGKYQSIERMESRREYERERKREYRAKQKLLSGDVSGTCPGQNGGQSTGRPTDVHSTEEEVDIDKDKEIDIDNTTVCTEPLDSERSEQDKKPAKSSRKAKKPESNPTPSEFNIPLNDGSTYNVPVENIAVYKQLYPGVDVEQQLRNMIGWSMNAGPKRKHRSGVKRFITNWLAREQNNATRRMGNGGYSNGSYSQRQAYDYGTDDGDPYKDWRKGNG